MQSDPPMIDTAYSHFLQRSEDNSTPPISLILRGVNLSSTAKFPAFKGSPKPPTTRSERDDHRRWQAGQQSHLGDSYSEAEAGGREGWFVGHPLPEQGIEVHLQRLQAWGFRVLRLIVTWEALEHAGPNQYDLTYMAYLVRILRRCKEYGFRVFISPHQDVFSRFLSGSGAPYWALLATGLNPRRVHQTGAAVVHHQWEKECWGGEEGREAVREGLEYPDMIWNTNLHRLASRHCFTMFFASEVFAPKCKINGEPVGQWLRDRHVGAYACLAEKLAEAGDLLDTCVIGWDSMNEPHEGFVGMPDLSTFPESQQFRKGPSPTPIQGFRLGTGQKVSDIAYDDFTSFGHKKLGTVTITPPGGEGVWLTRAEADRAAQQYGWQLDAEWDFWDHEGCVWAGHGVWDSKTGNLLKPDYFAGDDFLERFWKDHYTAYIGAIRQHHPVAIGFVNPPVFGSPPDLDATLKQGRMALSPHFYDGLTMLGKRRHRFNANAVGLQRGNVSMINAIKIGTSNIKSGIRAQFEELKSDARKKDGIADDLSGKKEYPTLIGELGVPFDMKKSGLLGLAVGKAHQHDYSQPAKAMDELLQGCDGVNALSYTIWDYEPTNTHTRGDGWNGEDLSLFSYDDIPGDDDLVADAPNDLRSLCITGARAVEAWCRPYPAEVMGRINSFTFDVKSTIFQLDITVFSLEGSSIWETTTLAKEGWSLLYLPLVHYLRTDGSTKGENRVLGRPGELPWQNDIASVADIHVLSISEGRLEIEGQWAKWYYPLRERGDRAVRLRLQKWRG